MTEKQPQMMEQIEDLTFNDWQDALEDGNLLGHECLNCNHVSGLPRGACDRCGSRDLSVVELPKAGEVYSETEVYVAPEGFEGGYGLAIISLGDARVLGRIDGDIEIGDEVIFSEVFSGTGDPAPVFEPAE